jgi:TolA-binding protein
MSDIATLKVRSYARIKHDHALQGAIEELKGLIQRLVQTNSRIRRKHAISNSYEQGIAEALSQSSQSMADRRLGEPEPVARGSQASKIPNCEKDPQQIEVKIIINPAHEAIYNYESVLVLAGRSRTPGRYFYTANTPGDMNNALTTMFNHAVTVAYIIN